MMITELVTWWWWSHSKKRQKLCSTLSMFLTALPPLPPPPSHVVFFVPIVTSTKFLLSVCFPQSSPFSRVHASYLPFLLLCTITITRLSCWYAVLYLIIIRKNGKTALTQSCVCVVDSNLLVFFFHSLYSHKASHHDSLVIVITSENNCNLGINL